MRESGRLMAHEISMVIPLLWLRWCLIHLRLHIGHSLGHVCQQLRLSSKELFHPYWQRWRWRLVVLLVLRSLVVLHCWG